MAALLRMVWRVPCYWFHTSMDNGITKSGHADLSAMTEVEAVELACEGDSRAFERLYQLHSKRVYRLCLRISGNPTEAEDLTQEAFLQLFRKIRTFRRESSFSTWLHRLTVNVVLMRFRKKRRQEVSLDATSQPGEEGSGWRRELGVPDLRLDGVVDHVNLGNAIDQLPRGYKEIFILHDVEGYEHAEIAGIVGCSIGNCKSQLFKARLRLRELLHESLRSRARDERASTRGLPVPEEPYDQFPWTKA
jgi:RNA polymerase sigma-70 factor, ECF subfamily